MSSIKDVAKISGFSVATVSRVINGNYPVKNSTREKVEAAIKACGYKQNIIAKSLKMNKSFSVGFVIPDFSNKFFMKIAKGMEDVLQEHGYNLIISSTNENPKREVEVLELMRTRQVDYIVLGTCQTDFTYIQELLDEGLKIIMVDTYIDKDLVDTILENNYDMSYEMTQVAINKGHKKISIVKGIETTSTGLERLNGFKAALSDNKLVYQDKYAVRGSFASEPAYQGTIEMLKNNLDDLPSLIYSCNNLMTEGVLKALKELGLKVAKDISIMSYGNIDLSELIEPKITHVKQNPISIGVATANRVLEKIQNNNLQAESLIVKSHLIKDDSLRDINE